MAAGRAERDSDASVVYSGVVRLRIRWTADGVNSGHQYDRREQKQ